MAISVEQFYHLLLQEIVEHKELQGYYRFLSEPAKEQWRKAYFCQRLSYIEKHMIGRTATWDIGCGYGTTALFLALNGYKVHGSTLEYYYAEIPQRIKFWSQHGDVSGFTYDYADLYESKVKEQYDAVIVQDTIHHTEPIKDALRIIHDSLVPGGKVIAVEENGMNIIQRLKLYKQRGNKRIIEIYDEKLNKKILLGNENIRPLNEWKRLFAAADMKVDDSSVEYVRMLPNFLFGEYEKSIAREQRLWRSNKLLRDYFFFGVSFCGDIN